MTWSGINDAWMTELTTNVAALTSVPAERQHKYAPWSVEQLTASVGERHIAIWPQSEAETVQGITVDGTDLATQDWVVLLWEDASVDTSRQQDDDTANAAWLALHEAVRARFYELDNIRLGDSTIMRTHYEGASFDVRGSNRVMALRFSVKLPVSVT